MDGQDEQDFGMRKKEIIGETTKGANGAK